MATLAHGAATPAVLTIGLFEMSEGDICPGAMHRTAGGALLTYVVGTHARTADLTFILLTQTEKNNFQSFYHTSKLANTPFTFIADPVYHPTDTWTAKWTSEPKYDRRKMPAGRVYDTVTIGIQDQAVAL